jgi:hypothetical protein
MTKITPKDIVEHLKTHNPKLAIKNDRQSAMLLRESLKLIKEAIENTNDDVVRVAGLGSFRGKTIERDKDGVKKVIKRIFFRPAKKKSDKV